MPDPITLKNVRKKMREALARGDTKEVAYFNLEDIKEAIKTGTLPEPSSFQRVPSFLVERGVKD